MEDAKKAERLTPDSAFDFISHLSAMLVGRRFTFIVDDLLGLRATQGHRLVPASATRGAISINGSGPGKLIEINITDDVLLVTVPPHDSANPNPLAPRFLFTDRVAVIRYFFDEGSAITCTFVVEGE